MLFYPLYLLTTGKSIRGLDLVKFFSEIFKRKKINLPLRLSSSKDRSEITSYFFDLKSLVIWPMLFCPLYLLTTGKSIRGLDLVKFFSEIFKRKKINLPLRLSSSKDRSEITSYFFDLKSLVIWKNVILPFIFAYYWEIY